MAKRSVKCGSRTGDDTGATKARAKRPSRTATAPETVEAMPPVSADAPIPDAGGSAGEPTGKTTTTATTPPVTGAVTEHPGIPEWLLRNPDNTWKHPPTPVAGSPSPPVPVPAAAASSGEPSGTSPDTAPSTLLDFDTFKVDPQEIENQIRREADRRYYGWEGPHRPRKSTLVKQVRKEFFK